MFDICGFTGVEKSEERNSINFNLDSCKVMRHSALLSSTVDIQQHVKGGGTLVNFIH